MHPSSLHNADLFAFSYLDEKEPLQIADVGSYDVNGTYRPIFARKLWNYVGIDIEDGPNVDVIVNQDNYRLALPSGSVVTDTAKASLDLLGKFDVVLSGQCLEHVRKPWLWIKQVASLGKEGCLYWITAPNTWGFHEYPIDCWRIWPDGMKALFDEAGLTCLNAYIDGADTVGIARKDTSPQEEPVSFPNLSLLI